MSNSVFHIRFKFDTKMLSIKDSYSSFHKKKSFFLYKRHGANEDGALNLLGLPKRMHNSRIRAVRLTGSGEGVDC